MLPILSRVVTRLFKLPPAETYNVVVERNLRVPMQDSTMLLADHYYTPTAAPRVQRLGHQICLRGERAGHGRGGGSDSQGRRVARRHRYRHVGGECAGERLEFGVA